MPKSGARILPETLPEARPEAPPQRGSESCGSGTPLKSPCDSPRVEGQSARELLASTCTLLEEVDALCRRQQGELRSCFEHCLGRQAALIAELLERHGAEVLGCKEVQEAVAPDKAAGQSPVHGQELKAQGTAEVERTPSVESAMRVAATSRFKKHVSDCIFEIEREKVTAEMTWFQRLVLSRAFELASGALIIFNAIFLGWEAQWKAEVAWEARWRGLVPNSRDPPAAIALTWTFCALFIVDLALRWMADGFKGFFRTADAGWNIFDIVVVCVGMGDQTLQLLNVAIPANISVLRVLRVLRIARVARIIRVMRFFRELRIMVFSIIGGLKSLVWLALILGLIFYVFGITLTMGVVSFLESDPSVPDGSMENLFTYFGTLDRSMLSLYMSMSGGNDWGQYYDSVRLVSGMYQVLFVVFITFSAFGVTNVVTGVFVDTAMQSSLTDTQVIVCEELEDKRSFLAQLGSLFRAMDQNNTGTVTREEFEKHLRDNRVVAYFHALKLDVSGARDFFSLLDSNQSGEISIDEFLLGCYKLQGMSTRVDVALMQQELRLLREAAPVDYQAAFAPPPVPPLPPLPLAGASARPARARAAGRVPIILPHGGGPEHSAWGA